MRRLLMIPALALSLVAVSACNHSASPPAAASSTATRDDAVFAVAGTTAAVADALNVAPPASLTGKTTIDEKGVRLAFLSFDGTLHVIDAWRATGTLVRNSPRALTIRRAVLTTKSALIAASAAQRAGAATSYRSALEQASIALDALRAALLNR